METTWAEFWKVVFMPDPAPRCCGGRLFIPPVRLGEPKEAMDRPAKNSTRPKTQYGKSTGRSSRRKKARAAQSMPPVAKGRAPYLSQRMPAIGPAVHRAPGWG